MSAGTSEEKLLCSADELEREDVRLNTEYKRVMAQYKAEGLEDKIAALRKAELDWLKSVKAKCGSTPFDAPDANQRMRSQWMNECQLDMKKTRADELLNMLEVALCGCVLCWVRTAPLPSVFCEEWSIVVSWSTSPKTCWNSIRSDALRTAACTRRRTSAGLSRMPGSSSAD